MERTVISWDVHNWVTVTLMAFIGLFVLGSVGVLLRRARGKTADE